MDSLHVLDIVSKDTSITTKIPVVNEIELRAVLKHGLSFQTFDFLMHRCKRIAAPVRNYMLRIINETIHDKTTNISTVNRDIVMDTTTSPGSHENFKNTFATVKRFCLGTPVNSDHIQREVKVKWNSEVSDDKYRWSISSETPSLIEPTGKKTFRLIDRYRFDITGLLPTEPADFRVFIDLSAVKSHEAESFNPSKLSPENYEYELEIAPIDESFNAADVYEIAKRAKPCIYFFLQGLHGGFAPIRDETLAHAREWYDAVAGSTPGKYVDNVPFIGGDAVSLSSRHLRSPTINNYTLTDKADGERFLALIYPFNETVHVDLRGKLFLIGRSRKLRWSGYTFSDKSPSQFLKTDKPTLLDVELLMTPLQKTSTGIQSEKIDILWFDTLFYGGEDIRTLPHYSSNPKDTPCRAPLPSRYRLRSFLVPQKESTLEKRMVTDMIKPKQFILYSRIFEETPERAIFNQWVEAMDTPGTKNYDVEGFIFTPTEDPYHEVKVVADKTTSTKWSALYKYKRGKDVSSDFQVVFEQDPSSLRKRPRVYNLDGPHYKALLFCSNHGKLIPFKIHNETQTHEYTMIPLDEHNVPRTRSGHVIFDKHVYEFIFDDKWIPIRYRPDKMTNHDAYPNNVYTATQNWKSMKENITIKQLTTPQPITKEYYSTSATKNLMKSSDSVRRRVQEYLLNVASKLTINRYKAFGSQEFQGRLLDIGFGRGGDVSNISRNWKIHTVLAIEPDPTNIEEALTRTKDVYRGELPMDSVITVVQGDITKKLKDGSLAANFTGKGIVQNHTTEPFDIVTAFMMIHHIADSDEHLRAFFYNANSVLSKGGTLVISALDGHAINVKFNEVIENATKEKELIAKTLDETPPAARAAMVARIAQLDEMIKTPTIAMNVPGSAPAWSITKQYTGNAVGFSGQRVISLNASISATPQLEHLVNFEHLRDLAKEYNFTTATQDQISAARTMGTRTRERAPGFPGMGYFAEPTTESVGGFIQFAREKIVHADMKQHAIRFKHAELNAPELEYNAMTKFLILTKNTDNAVTIPRSFSTSTSTSTSSPIPNQITGFPEAKAPASVLDQPKRRIGSIVTSLRNPRTEHKIQLQPVAKAPIPIRPLGAAIPIRPLGAAIPIRPLGTAIPIRPLGAAIPIRPLGAAIPSLESILAGLKNA